MTPDDIKKARELIAAATPGKWSVGSTGDYVKIEGVGSLSTMMCWPKDATFIAAARTGWPEALDHVEFLQKEILEYWSEEVHKLRDENDALKLAYAGVEGVGLKLGKEVRKLHADNERYAQAIEDIPVLTAKEQQELIKLRAVAEAAQTLQNNYKGIWGGYLFALEDALKSWRGDKC